MTLVWALETTAAAAVAGADQASRTRPLQLRGLVAPLARDGKGDFANSADVDLILSNARQILAVQALSPDGPGELDWDQEFGSWLHLLRHQNMDELLEAQAQAYVVMALSRWEPRVFVSGVSVTRDEESRALTITPMVDIIVNGSLLASNQTIEIPLEVA